MDNNTVIYSKLKDILQDLWIKAKGLFIQDITFENTTKTLKKHKNGNTEVVIDHVVEHWGDLEHTQYAPIQNIFDKTKTQQDKHYTPIAGQIGTILDNTDYVVGYVPCLAGEQFTIIKGATHDSRQAGVFNSQRQCIHNMNLSYRTVKGKQVYDVEIPANLTDAAFFAFNMHKVHTNPDEVMVFEGHLTDDQIPSKYYPNLGNYTAVIDGDKVAIEFNKDSTSLQSNTVVEAIKELDGKIANAGGGTVTSVNGVAPVGGNVTVEITNIQGLQDSLNNKVDRTEVGNDANKIPRLNNGKLVDTIIPELAITKIVDVQNQQQALEQVNNGTIQVGDSVRLTSEQNKVYQYTGGTTGIFTDRFIEISQGDATVKTINNQSPVNGNVTVNATHINANVGGNDNTVQHYLTTIGNGLDTVNRNVNGIGNRVTKLESKHPTHVVGEVMVCYDKGSSFTTKEGAVFLHLNGQLVQHRNYPDLASALGITTAVNSYYIPRINDITDRFDNSSKNAVRKHYVCAKA